MANTYTSFHYHFTFSTKNREPWITSEIETRVWAYIGGVARKHKIIAVEVGGIEDHIHALVLAPPTIAPSQIAQYLKGDSSKWIHEEFSNCAALSGRTATEDSASVNLQCRMLLNTSEINASTIARELFRKNIWSC